MSTKSISWSTEYDITLVESYKCEGIAQNDLFYSWSDIRQFHVEEVLRTEKSFALRLLEKLPSQAPMQDRFIIAQILQLLERKTEEVNSELVEFGNCEGMSFFTELGRKKYNNLWRHLSSLKLISDRTITKAKTMVRGKLESEVAIVIYKLLRFLAHRERILFKQLLYEFSELDGMKRNQEQIFSCKSSSAKRTISLSRRVLAVQRRNVKKHKKIDMKTGQSPLRLPTINEEEEFT